MNSDQLQGKWKQLCGGMQQRWGALTGDPAVFGAGTRDRLDGRNLELRGAAKREADRQLTAFLKRNRYWSDLSKH